MRANVPGFECPDSAIEEIYYFRWWTFRKHLKRTPNGFVVTEFLPEVPWAGKYNTISCAAGHHFYEGRWIHDPVYLDAYARFWFSGGGEPRKYSFWAADAIYQRSLVSAVRELSRELLPRLAENFRAWEKSQRDRNGLFWQIDDRDGMEYSLGGSGYRPTINSYMLADAQALTRMAGEAGDDSLRSAFEAESLKLRELLKRELWDADAEFYKTKPRGDGALPVSVREVIGFVPWYFNIPGRGRETAWKQLFDPDGFLGKFGPTTAERRSRGYFAPHGHECLWNGPSWPFATTQTLVALSNLLNNYEQEFVTSADYCRLLQSYAKSQHRRLDDGSIVPWIDEDLHPDSGEWIARGILQKLNRPDKERGAYYNHSAFCDLVITGLVGLRPRADQIVEINPLAPAGQWSYFCLENVRYRGHILDVIYDSDGSRYGRGTGLRLFIDGRQAAHSERVQRLKANLKAG